jgi:ABC-type nitrate/sulfonate/bicarbonate transport system ATPase subunit
MRMVGGLETATNGEMGLAARSPAPIGESIVFQPIPRSRNDGLRNIRFGLRYRDDVDRAEKKRIAAHYMDLVGLRDFADFYVNRISGGMRQRVAIARTLAAGPDVLLMDEPFGALDAQTREFLQYQLLGITRSERKTVIFVTHDIEKRCSADGS